MARKLPKNPIVGKTYVITTASKNGNRKVSFLAKKKSGFGMWQIKGNKPVTAKKAATKKPAAKKSAKKA